jgi:hypothetical protein
MINKLIFEMTTDLSTETIMPQINRIILLFLLVSFFGCAGIRVSHDYPEERDYLLLKTYAWQSEIQEMSGDLRLDSPFRDARIRKAINKFLQEKGYRRVMDDRPDFTIAYHQKIYRRIDSDEGSGFVFGIGSIGSHGGVGFSAGNRTSSYDEVMLVIDIMDAESADLIWRGTGTRTYIPHIPPEKVTRRIEATVQKILAQFPPQEK